MISMLEKPLMNINIGRCAGLFLGEQLLAIFQNILRITLEADIIIFENQISFFIQNFGYSVSRLLFT